MPLVGPDAAYVIDRVTTRNVDKIGVGRSTYAAILNSDGKFIDDCVIYHLNVKQLVGRAWYWYRHGTVIYSCSIQKLCCFVR